MKNLFSLVPQVPQAWANHVIYGGALGAAALVGAVAAGLEEPALCALQAVFTVAALKKLTDYIVYGESAAMCVGKAFVTAVWPASTWLVIQAYTRGWL